MDSKKINSISVIIPVYNAEKTILRALNSVLAQTTYEYIKEIIVIDDCSTDNTLSVIGDLKRFDSKIKILTNKKNSGAGVCRKLGVDAASAQFVAFLDSDDEWSDDKIESQTEFMSRLQVDFSCTSYIKVDGGFEKMVVDQPEIIKFKRCLTRNYIATSTVICNRMVIKNKMSLLRKRQDWATWLSVLKERDCICLKKAMMKRHRSPGSLSEEKFSLLRYNFWVLREEGGLNISAATVYLIKNILNKIRGQA